MPTVGRKAKKDEAHTQSVVFDKKRWDKSKCLKWLAQQGYKADGLDESDDSFRFRQYDPDDDAFRYRNKTLGNGVTLVLALPAEETAAAKFADEGLQYEWAHDESSDTYTIKGVEIFAAGRWNGEPYDDADLEQMADADADLHDLIRPRVKLGHAEAKDDTAEPALGWIGRIQKRGAKLLANLSRLPRELFEAIQRGRYTRQSVEIRLNYKHPETGKRYPFVIDALAFLGAKLPAVATLKPIAAFDGGEAGGIWLTQDEPAEKSGGESSPVQSFQQVEPETVPPIVEAQGGKMDEKELKAREERLAELEKAIAEREAKATADSKAVADERQRLHASKIDGMWKRLLEDGKVRPGEEQEFKAIASRIDDTERIKFSEGEATALDMHFKSWQGRPVVGKKTEASAGTPAEDKGSVCDRLEGAAKKYMNEEQVTFAVALGMAEKAHPEWVDQYRKERMKTLQRKEG